MRQRRNSMKKISQIKKKYKNKGTAAEAEIKKQLK